MESHFNLARKQKKNRTMIDAARVNLGMAQANCTFDSYCDLIRENVPALLMWKNKRTKF